MTYLYVAIFGACGAAMRYWISSSLEQGMFPYHTLLVNIVGCFLLAMAVQYLTTLPKLSRNLINGLGTGFVGSFTTFSTFSVEVSQLIMKGAWFYAGSYIFVSVMGGLLSAGLGFYVSSRLIQRKENRENVD